MYQVAASQRGKEHGRKTSRLLEFPKPMTTLETGRGRKGGGDVTQQRGNEGPVIDRDESMSKQKTIYVGVDRDRRGLNRRERLVGAGCTERV
jgi:hypothetical protein